MISSEKNSYRVFRHCLDQEDRRCCKAFLDKLWGIVYYYARKDYQRRFDMRELSDIVSESCSALISTYGKAGPDRFQADKPGADPFESAMYKTIARTFWRTRKLHSLVISSDAADHLEDPALRTAADIQERQLYLRQAGMALGKCLKQLRQKSEIHWLVFRIWAEQMYHTNLDKAVGLMEFTKTADATLGETEKIALELERIAGTYAGQLGLSAETIAMATAPRKANTIKSDIRRAKDFLRKCLQSKGFEF